MHIRPEHIASGITAVIVAAIIKIKALIKWCKDTYAYLSAEWTKLSPIILPIVIEVEQISLAGPITPQAKKRLAMDTLHLLEQRGIIKLNWIQEQVLSVVIDHVAESLPSPDVSAQVKQIVAELNKKGA